MIDTIESNIDDIYVNENLICTTNVIVGHYLDRYPYITYSTWIHDRNRRDYHWDSDSFVIILEYGWDLPRHKIAFANYNNFQSNLKMLKYSIQIWVT